MIKKRSYFPEFILVVVLCIVAFCLVEGALKGSKEPNNVKIKQMESAVANQVQSLPDSSLAKLAQTKTQGKVRKKNIDTICFKASEDSLFTFEVTRLALEEFTAKAVLYDTLKTIYIETMEKLDEVESEKEFWKYASITLAAILTVFILITQ